MVSALPELNPDSRSLDNLLGIFPHAVACVARYNIDRCKTNPGSSRRAKKQLVGLSPDCGGNEPPSGQEQTHGSARICPKSGQAKRKPGDESQGATGSQFYCLWRLATALMLTRWTFEIRACDWEGWQVRVSLIYDFDKIISHVQRREQSVHIRSIAPGPYTLIRYRIDRIPNRPEYWTWG